MDAVDVDRAYTGQIVPRRRSGLSFELSSRLDAVVVPQPFGMATTTITVPNDPVFAGLPVLVQALMASQERFTNVVSANVLP